MIVVVFHSSILEMGRFDVVPLNGKYYAVYVKKDGLDVVVHASRRPADDATAQKVIDVYINDLTHGKYMAD